MVDLAREDKQHPQQDLDKGPGHLQKNVVVSADQKELGGCGSNMLR